MGKFLSISHNTFVQTIRQPIFGILILVTFAILVLEVSQAGWTMTNDYVVANQKLLQDLGLSTLLMFSGVLLAAFSASSVLAREIEDRTALTVISKPVSRGMFVLGKFTGVSAAVTVGFYLCSLVFLMTVRHRPPSTATMPTDWPVITLGLVALGLSVLVGLIGNYSFGWHFTSAAVWSAVVMLTLAMGVLLFVGKGWQIVPMGYDSIPGPDNPDAFQLITPQLLVGILLIYLAALIFCAVAVTSSTRLGQMITLLVCLGVFALGSMHPPLAHLAQGHPALYALTWASPDLTYFYGLDSDKPVPLYVVGSFALYCLVYVAAVISLGIALFQTRQLESQQTSTNMPGVVGLLARIGILSAAIAAIWGIDILCRLLWPDPSVILKPGAAHGYQATSGTILLVFAAWSWWLWGCFVRGQRWAYWTVLVFSALSLVATLPVLLSTQVRQKIVVSSDTQIMVLAAIDAFVVLILVLPKTRRHFEFHLRKKSIKQA
jgi:ABC-type transport system involved in multi-copper enzyme maturation permease subunit